MAHFSRLTKLSFSVGVAVANGDSSLILPMLLLVKQKLSNQGNLDSVHGVFIMDVHHLVSST
jgi:hypothetical protein